MRGVILYQSKYGATKKYAGWLAEETGFACMETKKAKLREIAGFDVILLGGGVYASGIAGLSFLKRHFPALRGKKIAVFCCGASPYDEQAFGEIVKRNMKDALSTIPCFYCRGAWDMTAMSRTDRALCNMLRKAVSKKDPAEYEAWEEAIMAAGQEKCDWTDKKYLLPILDCVRKR